jgi:hypothetical protein
MEIAFKGKKVPMIVKDSTALHLPGIQLMGGPVTDVSHFCPS